MANKKAKKAAAKKAPPKKGKPKVKSPRSQVLPGMEQVRNRTLDRVCEGLSDVRREMALNRTEEASLIQHGLSEMTDKGIKFYRASGIEMALVPGDAHLRVRTVKEKANQNAAPAEETGSGQDAGEIAEALTEGDGAEGGDE